MPIYKLMYFGFKALAEPIRFLFHYGAIDFEDYHYTKDEWFNDIKPKSPFGQGPLLIIDGETFFQSVAIQRLLAEQIGIAGETNLDKAKIDMIVETIWDVRCMLYRYCFDKPENKKAVSEKLFNNDLPYLIAKLDKIVAENGGYFYGGKLSWPDLQWSSMYEYLCTLAGGRDVEASAPNLTALRNKILTIPSIKAYVEKRPQKDPDWENWSLGGK